jgi:hypothetical protein
VPEDRQALAREVRGASELPDEGRRRLTLRQATFREVPFHALAALTTIISVTVNYLARSSVWTDRNHESSPPPRPPLQRSE